MKAVVKKVSFPAGRRVLAISDIHGNLDWFQGLLSKAGYSGDDILVLMGDLVEKGPKSLATLRYIMELSRRHTIYSLCGNCDNLAVDFAGGSQGTDWGFYPGYLRFWGERCLLIQMGLEAGVQVRGQEDLPALREAVRANFQPELAFLSALPTILETEDFVFVHGGVPSFDRMEELDAWGCMKNDNFMSQGHAFPKFCVVGHWPVTLYREKVPDCDPLIDRDRRIISIDGGCGVKEGGQLNALILPWGNAASIACLRYDGYPRAIALEDQAPSRDPVTIRWVDNAVEELERGEEFTLCRHISSGRTILILNSYLRRREGRTCCEDSTDYRLGVSAGDRLAIVEETAKGSLVKRGGVIGWYFGRMKKAEKGENIR